MKSIKLIKVLHVSDLHISEDIPTKDVNLTVKPRYGHDFSTFLALDQTLNSIEWDILIISGDITRIGNEQSFIWAKNWIEREIQIENNLFVGLNLIKKGKPYVVVPGNHDRFNGKTTQSSLGNYNKLFPVIGPDCVVTHIINGVKVNLHLYDSSTDDGSFGYGRIDNRDKRRKILNEEDIDIAVLHHHLVQPPDHQREPFIELINPADDVAYFLSCNFNAILFGHTHKAYGAALPTNLVLNLMSAKGKRKKGAIWKKMMPKYLTKKFSAEDNDSISYKREKTRLGQFPTFNKHFQYLYLKNIKMEDIKGPECFDTIDQFYDELDDYESKAELVMELINIKRNRVLISKAPSACQSEAENNGFSLIEFKTQNLKIINTTLNLFEYIGNGQFVETKTKSIINSGPFINPQIASKNYQVDLVVDNSADIENV